MVANPRVRDSYDDVIYDAADAVEALERETGWIALDLETGGLSPWTDPIAVFSLYGQKSGTSAVLHTRGNTPDFLIEFLSQPGRKFVTHNGAGFDLLFLANEGVDIYGPEWYDTLIGEACTLVTNRRDVRVNLQDTLKRRLGVNIKKGLGTSPWMALELSPEQLKYCVEDIQFLPRLREKQLQTCAGDSRAEANRFEQALAPIVVEMVMNGLPFDKAALDDYKSELEIASAAARARLESLFAGVNLNSPAQLIRAFNAEFPDELGDEGLTSTNRETLTSLVELKTSQDVEEGTIGQAAEDLLIYRQATKRTGMYSDEWIGKYVHNGRCHSRFWQIGTDTGRFCVAADTRVEMPRDLTRYPHGVPISEVKVGDLVYSFTPDKRLVLRPVKWVGKTGTKQTIKITARCDKHGDVVSFRATPEHLVRLRGGDWRYTGALKVGDRLLCMPHRAISDEGYAYFSATSYFRSEAGKYNNPKVKEHRWVMSQILGRRLNEADTIHHKDENKINNAPGNLERFASKRDHIRHHRATNIDTLQGMLDGTVPLTVHPKTLRRLAKRYGLQPTPTNHTVIAVEPGPVEDVWDIEVEDTHTFIGEGVALHNSSSEPNLQQVPRTGRKIFKAPPGYSYFKVDYSQLEVAVAAILTGDDQLLEDMKTGDVHRQLASSIYHLPPEQITPEQRKSAKAATFTCIFFGSPKALVRYARMLGQKLSEEEAQEIHAGFFRRYRGLASARMKARSKATHSPSVTIQLPTGLKRQLTGDNLTPQRLMNTTVQGTAAAGLKKALVLCKERGLMPYIGAVVHDEIVGCAPTEIAESIMTQVEQAMVQGMHDILGREETDTWTIVAEGKVGPTWAG